MSPARVFHLLTLTGFFGLMLTLLGWILLAPHAENFPVAAMLLLGVVPLLFPLRGLLHARPYTHAWASFLMLFYFSHAIGELYSADTLVLYPLLSLLFSTLCFCSALAFIRLEAKSRKNARGAACYHVAQTGERRDQQ